ncbi:hypothetical protein BJ742DRAFT_794611 [Cladochytrium replicatum]|nr:hypothetical protein BJ742DRAFT_794611 [Cladochytrium replicatum]
MDAWSAAQRAMSNGANPQRPQQFARSASQPATPVIQPQQLFSPTMGSGYPQNFQMQNAMPYGQNGNHFYNGYQPHQQQQPTNYGNYQAEPGRAFAPVAPQRNASFYDSQAAVPNQPSAPHSKGGFQQQNNLPDSPPPYQPRNDSTSNLHNQLHPQQQFQPQQSLNQNAATPKHTFSTFATKVLTHLEQLDTGVDEAMLVCQESLPATTPNRVLAAGHYFGTSLLESLGFIEIVYLCAKSTMSGSWNSDRLALNEATPAELARASDLQNQLLQQVSMLIQYVSQYQQLLKSELASDQNAGNTPLVAQNEMMDRMLRRGHFPQMIWMGEMLKKHIATMDMSRVDLTEIIFNVFSRQSMSGVAKRTMGEDPDTAAAFEMLSSLSRTATKPSDLEVAGKIAARLRDRITQCGENATAKLKHLSQLASSAVGSRELSEFGLELKGATAEFMVASFQLMNVIDTYFTHLDECTTAFRVLRRSHGVVSSSAVIHLARITAVRRSSEDGCRTLSERAFNTSFAAQAVYQAGQSVEPSQQLSASAAAFEEALKNVSQFVGLSVASLKEALASSPMLGDESGPDAVRLLAPTAIHSLPPPQPPPVNPPPDKPTGRQMPGFPIPLPENIEADSSRSTTPIQQPGRTLADIAHQWSLALDPLTFPETSGVEDPKGDSYAHMVLDPSSPPPPALLPSIIGAKRRRLQAQARKLATALNAVFDALMGLTSTPDALSQGSRSPPVRKALMSSIATVGQLENEMEQALSAFSASLVAGTGPNVPQSDRTPRLVIEREMQRIQETLEKIMEGHGPRGMPSISSLGSSMAVGSSNGSYDSSVNVAQVLADLVEPLLALATIANALVRYVDGLLERAASGLRAKATSLDEKQFSSAASVDASDAVSVYSVSSNLSRNLNKLGITMPESVYSGDDFSSAQFDTMSYAERRSQRKLKKIDDWKHFQSRTAGIKLKGLGSDTPVIPEVFEDFKHFQSRTAPIRNAAGGSGSVTPSSASVTTIPNYSNKPPSVSSRTGRQEWEVDRVSKRSVSSDPFARIPMSPHSGSSDPYGRLPTSPSSGTLSVPIETWQNGVISAQMSSGPMNVTQMNNQPRQGDPWGMPSPPSTTPKSIAGSIWSVNSSSYNDANPASPARSWTPSNRPESGLGTSDRKSAGKKVGGLLGSMFKASVASVSEVREDESYLSQRVAPPKKRSDEEVFMSTRTAALRKR